MNQELITESADEYFVKRLYNSKNKNYFIEAISLTDWSEMYGASDTQGACDQFHNTLMELHNKYFPKVRMKKGSSNRKPWLSEALRNCIKCKNKLYHVYKKVPSAKNEIC